MNIYKLASKMKFRFNSTNGILMVEDLWELPMTGSGSIDELAIRLDREIKSTEQDSFVKPKDPVSKEIKAKFDLVIDIIETRTLEAELIASASVRKMKRNKLLQAKARIEDASFDNMTKEEIDAELAALDN